jgi:hypothetical protein
MPFIALSRFVAGAVIAVSTCSALAARPSPRILSEPVLGLRYEAARVAFDPLPGQVLANCAQLDDNEDRTSVWFIYAQAQDASGRTYYATGGYDIPRNAPGKPRSNTGDEGLILLTDRGSCTTLEQVRQTFDARLFDDEITQPVLRLLAADYVKRLERAFGGAARLRTELRNQHIDKEALPAELLEALKPYF